MRTAATTFEYLKKKGYQTAIRLLSQKWREADEEERERHLHLQKRGDRVLENRLVYLADERPAVYTVGRLPESLFIRNDVQDMSFAYIHVLVRDYMGRMWPTL